MGVGTDDTTTKKSVGLGASGKEKEDETLYRGPDDERDGRAAIPQMDAVAGVEEDDDEEEIEDEDYEDHMEEEDEENAADSFSRNPGQDKYRQTSHQFRLRQKKLRHQLDEIQEKSNRIQGLIELRRQSIKEKKNLCNSLQDMIERLIDHEMDPDKREEAKKRWEDFKQVFDFSAALACGEAT